VIQEDGSYIMHYIIKKVEEERYEELESPAVSVLGV
jgi:hypothetical protein